MAYQDEDFLPQPVAAAPVSLEDIRISKLQSKLDAVSKASREKVATLSAQRAAIAGQTAAVDADLKAQENSWVGKLGLNPNGVVGGAVNLISGAIAGGSRQIVGATLAAPFSWDALTNDLGLTQKHIDAYNRYKEGKQTADDMALLNQTKEVANPSIVAAMPGDVPADMTPLKTTILDAIKGADSSRKIARNINDTFNIDSIEHQGSKNQLDAQLGEGFQEPWSKITNAISNGAPQRPDAVDAVAKGNIDLGSIKYPRGSTTLITDKDGNQVLVPSFDPKTGNGLGDYQATLDRYKKTGEHLGIFKTPEAAMKYDVAMADASQNQDELNPKQGLGGRAADIASGIAGLLTNAGKAAIHNKMGVAQYVSENAPQLLIGAFGAAGKAGMAASNIGYAADYYEKGIEKFQADNGGKMPDTGKIKEIAAWAASLAIAEHLGDEVGVHAMKLGKKAGAEGVQEGLKASLRRTLGSTAEGLIGETVTEGYQTYAEGQAEGKPATAEDIYKSAVIGGLSGGILSGGAHAVAETTGTAPEQVKAKVAKVEKAVAYQEAVKSGDTTVFTDPESKHFDPAMAVGALHDMNMAEDATSEQKNANFDKATQIVTDLTAKKDELVKTINTGTAEEQKAARKEMPKVTQAIAESDTRWNRMLVEINKAEGFGTVDEQVTAANTAMKDAAPEVRANAEATTDNVINLSMASPSHMSAEQAATLAENTDNGLSTEQRTFLRTFSEARQAFNEAQTISTVNKAVMGTGKSNDLGIVQYRNRIGMAVSSGNQEKATADLALLTKFATSHAEKAAVAQEAFDKYGAAGQVYKTDSGWGAAKPGTYKAAELLAGGGLPIVKPTLLHAMKAEAKALAATRDEMTAAVQLKFGTSQKSVAPVQSAAPAANIPTSPKNNLPQGLVEDSSRPPVTQVAPAPAPVPKDTHAGKKFEKIDAGYNYIRDNKLGSTHRVEQTGRSEYTIKAKQASKAANVNAGNEKQARVDAAAQPRTPSLASPTAQTKLASVIAQREEYLRNPPADHTTDRTVKLVKWAEAMLATVNEARASVAENTDEHTSLSDHADSLKNMIKEGNRQIEADTTIEKATNPQAPVAPSTESTPSVSTAEAVSTTDAAPSALAENTQENPAETLANEASAPAESVVGPAVEAVAEKAAPGATYQQKKLGDFFTQSVNALGTIKDFLTTATTPDEMAKLAGIDSLASGQGTALRAFVKYAKAWQAGIAANIFNRAKPDYNYEDMMQHFIRPDGSIEENVKTAIAHAVFTYVAENFGSKAKNNFETMNTLMGRPVEQFVNQEERAVFEDLTASMPAMIDTLGQRVVKALGLKALPTAPVNEISRVEAALGAHALRVLVDAGLMTMETVTPQQMAVFQGEHAPVGVTSRAEDLTFMKIVRDENRDPTAEAQEITEAVKGAKGIVNNLFAIEAAERPPTFEPVTKQKAFAKRTAQVVPTFLKRIIGNLNKQQNFLRQDKLEVLQVLGDELFLKAMGVKEEGDVNHVANRDSIIARNDGLMRELANIKEFIKSYLGENLEQAFYFEHYAMKQQRVGIANSLVNPQLSKIHRFMVYRNSWKTTVDMTDAAQVQNFWLRVGEGMGVKVDKNNRSDAMDQITELLFNEKVQAGVAALRKINTGEALSQAEKQAIVDAVAVGGENAHSLDALMGMAQYYEANDAKKAKFDVNMLSEVDGVTNGPMLSHLLMGAADSVASLMKLLNRGGFYESENTQFNDYRSVAGHEDLYENTTRSSLDIIPSLVSQGEIDGTMLKNVMHFMGKLTDPVTGAILKDGRNMIKTPLTAMVYGSGIKTAIEGMAKDFLANIYKQMEVAAKLTKSEDAADRSKGQKMNSETLAKLKAMGIAVPANVNAVDMMEQQFTKQEENQLIGTFMTTLGVAVEAAIRRDFKELLANRETFNGVASVTFDMYNAAYDGLRNQLIDELVKSGDITASKNDNALHDLNPAQEKILDERMANITPVLQTAMSNLSGPATAHTGMLVADSEMQPSKSLAYKNVVHFARGFKGTAFGAGTKSLTVYGRQLFRLDPGVGLGATSTHSFDSAVAHTAIGNNEVLNLHDAGGTGIHAIVEHGRRMNKALWDRALNWSPSREMFHSMMRTVEGMNTLIESGKAPNEVMTALAKSLVAQSEKSAKKDPETGRWSKKTPPETILMARALQAFDLANKTDAIKFGGMAVMQSVAQYAIEGGNYQVTEQDRRSALAKLDNLPEKISAQDSAAVAALIEQLKPFIEAAKVEAKAEPSKPVKLNELGKLGRPAVNSDQKIVNFFSKGNTRSINEVAAFLKSQNLTGFQQKLLASLMKSLGARGSEYTVNFLSKDSKLDDVLEPPTGPSHAWFVSKDGVNAIYVLSPDFKESGLTVETLLHEMTHAAVAHAIENPTAETRPLVAELEELRAKAAQMIYDLKLPHLAPAVSSVQELVAWGMTNPEFQAVLDSFNHETANSGNKWVSGFQSFIKTLVELVFGKQNESAATAFASLVTNVTGLMAASAKSAASTANINQSMAAAQPSLASLKGEEMYDALTQIGNTTVNQQFDTKLRNVLNQMEQSVHSPLQAMKDAALLLAPQTPFEMWDKMKTAGLADFAKSALSSGFTFSEQEAFAAQQVEATIRTSLTNSDGSTTAVYRELARLYNEVKDNMKTRVAEFHSNPAQAQALHDFIFKLDSDTGNMSDYLSRFAALGLTNEKFALMLNFTTTTQDKSMAGLTFGEKLAELFERALAWINAKATNTFAGQHADDKLQALVNQLVHIEQSKRFKLAQSAGVAVDTFEKMFRTGFNAARTGVTSVATSKFFTGSTNGIIRFTGTAANLVTNDKIGQYFDTLQTFRDQTMKERNGILMGLVNETRGATAMNVMYHKLLRVSKYIEGKRKEIMNGTKNFMTEAFVDGGKKLTKQHKTSLTYGLMRTDVSALLGKFDIKDISKLFSDPRALKSAIANYEQQLSGFKFAKDYANGANALGLYLATNEVGAENLRFNEDNIAQMFGTQHAGKVAPAEATAAAPIINVLASLYALSHLDPVHTSSVREVFQMEDARTDGHGIEMLLKMHKDLQQQSKDRLFQASGALRMKGYTPEVYNPYIRLEVANSKDVNADGKTAGQLLEERGYSVGASLKMDSADPKASDKMRIYSLRDGGMIQYLTGVFSYTGKNSRGTETHNGDLGLLSVNGLMNIKKMQAIAAKQAAGIAAQGTGKIDPAKNAKTNNYLVPVFNANGEVVNYRYMMNAATKDGLLERTNEFDHLMGVMAGSIYDKEQTAVQNETAVQALYDQYKQDFGKNAGSYIEVGPNSTDKEAREVWRLLPYETKESVRKIFGSNSMMVRYDVLDINFGYRKNSLATPFGIPEVERSNFEAAYVQLLEGMLGKKAGLYARRFEDGWQQLVREAKDTMVVKSGVTLLGNFTSNVTELIWFGVPLVDIWHHHRVALKGVTSYRKDSKALNELETALRLKQLGNRTEADVKGEIVKLKDALARNPVRELVEAGMMPTIVEDVAQEEDRYSYKGQLTSKIDEFVGNLNPHVLKAGKILTMSADTPLYKALSYGTQVSDFVARYTLHQHVLNRKNNPLAGEKALQLVSDAFVNYDVPSHRDVQYANDMGLVYFTKYYLRIQKVIALLYRENPGRAMMLLTAGHFLDFIPMLTHSQILHRIGNPFSTGAFEALSSMDEMLTVKTLMTPFR